MQRQLSVGDTLGEVFSIYRSQAGVLLPVAFWLFLIVAIVSGLASGNVSLFPVVLLIGLVAGTLYQGIVVGLVRDVQDGRRDSTVGDLFGYATPVLLPLIGAGLLSGVGVGIGLFLLIAPGLFLLTIWAVIAPVIVIERSGVLAAFGRSRELVRGSGWPVFGALVVAFVISLVGGAIFGTIAAAISDGPIVQIVFSALASTITAPIEALVAGVLYYRLLALASGPSSPGDGADQQVPFDAP